MTFVVTANNPSTAVRATASVSMSMPAAGAAPLLFEMPKARSAEALARLKIITGPRTKRLIVFSISNDSVPTGETAAQRQG
jgi:hypothetical protein